MRDTTIEEKRMRVRARLAEPDAASLSARQVARELGVSQPFVSGLRREATRADAPARLDDTRDADNDGAEGANEISTGEHNANVGENNLLTEGDNDRRADGDTGVVVGENDVNPGDNDAREDENDMLDENVRSMDPVRDNNAQVPDAAVEAPTPDLPPLARHALLRREWRRALEDEMAAVEARQQAAAAREASSRVQQYNAVVDAVAVRYAAAVDEARTIDGLLTALASAVIRLRTHLDPADLRAAAVTVGLREPVAGEEHSVGVDTAIGERLRDLTVLGRHSLHPAIVTRTSHIRSLEDWVGSATRHLLQRARHLSPPVASADEARDGDLEADERTDHAPR